MTERIPKINALIKKELSQIILKEIEFPAGVLATLTRVETSVDLTNAKVYISVLPAEKTERVLEILNKMIYELQKILNKQLMMRPIPKIRFIEEKQTRTAARIEEILEKLKKEEK